ncbi:helix-turn-helix domain-containing protein [Actinoplanes sp. CA-015351]|uniref:helix-turn-helix domain-containing protein n=1 Tax=Actinoplanes sp. CA-015351 TaxID=3239897 RepID=UPI003D996339
MTDTALLDAVLAEWGHDPHTHEEHQFLYVPLGRIVVTAEGAEHVIEGASGLWMPAGIEHSARFGPDALVIAEEFDAGENRLPYRAATAVEMTPLARRSLLARARSGDEGLGCPELFATLVALRGSRLPLPEPQSRIPRAVARQLTEQPADARTAAEWASVFFTSSTSLRRAFRAETGLAFTEWRTRLRLNLSLDLLAKGNLVGAVAARVGFTSANGYILAFRRHFGETPGAYLARHCPGGPFDVQLQDS